MNGKLFVAKFQGTKGRYLVTDEGGTYGGQKIRDARQEKYGNKPDEYTGLYLDENYRIFGKWEVVSIREFVPPVRQAS